LSLFKYIKKVALVSFSYLPSELKIFIYRCMGAKIGTNVEIGLGSYILPYDNDCKKIRIENDVIIEDGVHILSRNLYLGNGTQIKNNTKISGQSDFTSGKNVYIDQDCHFDVRRNISLGNEVVISGGCWFYTHMVFQSVLEGAPFKFGPVIVEERTYFGANGFVLPDITIGHDSIIGARSVVTKNVNTGTVMVGQPAKDIGKTSQRTRQLTPAEKNSIVKDILLDFIQVHREKITSVKPWDTVDMFFIFLNQTILFLPRADQFSVVDEKIKKFNNYGILISFEIPEIIKTDCEKNGIFWFDLASRTKSSKKNKNSLTLERFFKNYGISIS